MSDLRTEITSAINKHSAENGSNTPDFILAEFLMGCLQSFDAAVNARTQWYKPPLRLREDTEHPDGGRFG